MDKSDVKVHERESDTSSVITMKEYAPSEYPSSEPPPAYMKPKSNALRIAKLAAFTIIISSIIFGGFILASSWIRANTAKNLALILNQELMDDLHPSYEHLIANEVLPEQQQNSLDEAQVKSVASDSEAAISSDKREEKTQNSQSNEEGLVPPPPPPNFEKSEEKKVMDLDEIANILMQKNIKGNVNCIVEKRKNEELVDHAPMSLNLPSPFGMNITTPPRLQHLTGEQMIVICKGDDDEENGSDSEEDEENENKIEQLQSIIFPLPRQLLHQIQQVPQVISLNTILPHIPLQQRFPMQQIPVERVPQMPLQQRVPVPQFEQIRMQQLPIQPVQIQRLPVQPMQIQQIPVQVPFHQIPFNRVNLPPFHPPLQIPQQRPIFPFPPPQQLPPQQPIFPFRPPQAFPQQQPIFPIRQSFEQVPPRPLQQLRQPPPQVLFPQPIQRPISQQVPFPQRVFLPQQPQQQQQQQNMPFPPQMIPLKEVGVNQNGIPLNHVLHNRVPINPLAVSDIPISRMQITHLPLRAEQQVKEEPVPVHHLVPPQVQPFPAENFKQEESRFNEPFPQEVINRAPFFPPQAEQEKQLPVEVRDPGVLQAPASLQDQPRMPSPGNPFLPHNLMEEREPELPEENRGFRQLIVDVKPRGERKEPIVNTLMPEMPKIIPLNFERRPMDSGRKIRFPDMVDSEEVKENRMPIITEITKIIPIRIEKEESEIPQAPANEISQPKNTETEKFHPGPRPFPIPINAILDMIFRGIRPLMGNRAHSMPIPIDIKIERIEKPMGLMTPPFIKTFEIIKKESSNPFDEAPNNESEKADVENDETQKDSTEAKVEPVEEFDKEEKNSSPVPVEGQDEQEKETEANEPSSFEDQAFLPNGQGRGARVFPIPQALKEVEELFSIFESKLDKNIEGEVPVGSSLTVMDDDKESENPENRQERFMEHPKPILNFFPISAGGVMKPFIPMMPKAQPEARSLKLLPVQNTESHTDEPWSPPVVNIEENRPHSKAAAQPVQ